MDGTELRRLREIIGLTQAELGSAMDVPRNSIARWERGEVPIMHPAMLRLAIQGLAIQRGKAAAVFSAPANPSAG